MYMIDKICVYIGNAGLFFMILSITIDVILRGAFSTSLPSIQQLDSELVMNLIVWLGISYVFLMGKHIKVDFIANKFPKKVQTFLFYFCNLGAATYFGFIGYYTAIRTIQAIKTYEISNSVLGYPLWPLYILAPIGCLMIIIRIIQYMISKKGIEEFRRKELIAQNADMEVSK